jgi:N-formylmaleamate deformylase
MSGMYGVTADLTYQRAGFGASVRRGSRPAIVVVDLTRGFTEDSFPSGADLTDVVAATTRLIDAGRHAGEPVPVVFTAIAYPEAEASGDSVAWLRKAPGMRALLEGSEAVDLDPRLPRQRDRDLLVVKKGASAFFGTDLAATLTGLGCDTVLVCGATTSGCVRATVVDAVQSGFSVLVPRECVGDRADGPADAALFDIQAKYGDVIGLDEAVDYLSSLSQRSIGQDALADLADVPAVGRWARSGDVRLHALDYGGDRPPLVVLPGITSPAITMDFVARELTDLVRPVVVDVRGRGLSDEGKGYELADYASDIEALITELDLDRPLLFGHSMGARIAAVVAARGAVPLRGAVLADPPLSGPGRAPYPTSLEAFLRQLSEARRGTDADEVALSWPGWPRREQELRARWLSSCARRAVVETHHGFEHEDFFDWWPAVPAPVALLYGADSPVVTAAGAAEVAAANPAAALHRIPAAGHMIFWDAPSTALAALRGALEAILSPSDPRPRPRA